MVGDRLYFYCSGRAGVPGTNLSGRCSTGLAFLRRDGFASMDANNSAGTLTTRPLRFSGKCLFVNADMHEGELLAEILNSDGTVMAPFSRENCVPVRTDSTRTEIRWRQATDLSSVAGKTVRFRFHMQMIFAHNHLWVNDSLLKRQRTRHSTIQLFPAASCGSDCVTGQKIFHEKGLRRFFRFHRTDLPRSFRRLNRYKC